MLRKVGERFIVFFPPSIEGPVCGGMRCEEKNTLDRKKLLCFVGGETASRKGIDEFLSQSTREACHLYHSEELRDEESLMQRAERRDS